LPPASVIGGLGQADLVERQQLAAPGKVPCDVGCATFFGNDVVACARRDHALDFGVGVTRIEREVRVFRPKCLVVGLRHLDVLDTGCLPALADEVEKLRFTPPEKPRQTLDPFVDLAEDCLVQAEALLTEIHRTMLTRSARGGCLRRHFATRTRA
jgi:hypothetical protein